MGLTGVRDRVDQAGWSSIYRFFFCFLFFVSSEVVGPEGQETAEITDFQRVRFCKVVAAAPPPGAAR